MAGIVIGIAVHNIATLFPTPAEVSGIVTETSVETGRRGQERVRIAISTEVGTFYAGGRPRYYSGSLQNSLRRGEPVPVTVQYSELTGGLVAIPELGTDVAKTGKFLWPAVGGVAAVFGLAAIRYGHRRYRGSLVQMNLLVLLVIGPLAGLWLVGPLDKFVTTLYARPL